MGHKSSKLTPEEEADLVNELQNVIKSKNLSAELHVSGTGAAPKSCPGCIACTCMICI